MSRRYKRSLIAWSCFFIMIITALSLTVTHQTKIIKDADSRLLKLERVVGELENETYYMYEFENQVYYDIALSKDLQEYTFVQCIKYDVDPILAFAVMKVESGYNENAVSESGDYGIMQINESNYEWLSKEFGNIDLLNAEDNIKCGVYMLSRIKPEDVHQKLMVYNLGGSQAKAMWSNGTYNTKYTNKVVDNMVEIKDKEMIL